MARRREERMEREVTPGELYGAIKVEMKAFDEGETKLVREKVPGFVHFCKSVHRRFPSLGKGGKFQPAYQEAIDFLGWPLTGEEFSAAITFVLYAGILVAVVLGAAIYFSPLNELLELFAGIPLLVPVYAFGVPVLLAVGVAALVQRYPLEAAKTEQLRALTYVPDIVGYLIMSMKLVPNLEKAVEFAAAHGRGKIANDFKKLIWDVQLGVYNSLSEGLDALAYRWGRFSTEFKHALMMVRASVLESTEAKRYALLDKTMGEVLESIRQKMEEYARALTQPVITLFYIGVLLPLILIIILPVGSTFSGTPLANPILLFLIYNIGIPLLTIAYALQLLKQRPPTYAPPIIPQNFPGVPARGLIAGARGGVSLKLVMVLVALVGIALSLGLSAEGLPPRSLMQEGAPQLLPHDLSTEEALNRAGYPPNYFDDNGPRFNELVASGLGLEKAQMRLALEKQTFYSSSSTDVTPYNLIFGILLTIGVLFYLHFHFTTIYQRRAQEKIEKMESEFKDAIYILASRMGENKPVEEAMKHTKEFLPQYAVSEEVFGKTIDNIALLGMPLEAAVFDPGYGALKNNPSSIIRGGMQLLIDSVQLGVNVAARTLISLSIQLDNSEKVNRTLTTLVSDVTGIMRSMAAFIAPVVLGITTVLQKVVIITLFSISSSSLVGGEGLAGLGGQGNLDLGPAGGLAGGFTGVNVSTLINPEAIGGLATPTQFVLIVSLYIIELVLILTYFTTKIQEDNDLKVRLNIAQTMPVALLVFVVSMVGANALVGGFLG